jgi:hypothetical protein
MDATIKVLILTIATVCMAGSGCSWFGSAGCPSMNTGGIELFECSGDQVKICETTEEGRCCTCDTPMTTAPPTPDS